MARDKVKPKVRVSAHDLARIGSAIEGPEGETLSFSPKLQEEIRSQRRGITKTLATLVAIAGASALLISQIKSNDDHLLGPNEETTQVETNQNNEQTFDPDMITKND